MEWHRSLVTKRGSFGKLHIAEKLLSGGYRALCNRSIFLDNNPYPENRLDEAKAKDRFCKFCERIEERQKK